MGSVINELVIIGFTPNIAGCIVAVGFIAVGVSIFDLAFSVVRLALRNFR